MRYSVIILLTALIFVACGSLDDTTQSTKTMANRSRAMLDKATPTADSRARRAGFGEGQKVHFITEMDGNRLSNGYTIRTRSHYNNRPANITETRQTYEMISRGENQRYQQIDHRRVITDVANGASLYLSETTEKDGVSKQRTVTIANKRALFRTEGDETQNGEIPVPVGVVFAVTPEWIIAQKPTVNAQYSVAVLDRTNREVITETVNIVELREQEVLGVQMDVWSADIRRNSNLTRIMFTTTGDLVSMQSDNLVMRVTKPDDANKDYAKLSVINSVPVSFQLAAWDNFNLLVYNLTPLERWREFIGDNNYQKINGAELQLMKNAPAIGKVNFPVPVTSLMRAYCERGENVRPDEGNIRERAQAIINREIRVVPAIALLAGWIYQNIAIENGTNNGDPLITLRKKTGDSEDHARLFASFTRSLNIPTRLCAGLLVQRENAARHFWCEVFLNEQWLPIDTTVNRVGLPAGYVLISTDDGNGIVPAKFAWAIREGGLLMEFTYATKNYSVAGGEQLSFTLYPESKKTYVAFSGNWLANLYWGFSVVKPEAWTGKIDLQSVTITSEDEEAIIKIEALNKVFPCTRAQLDMITNSLQTTLKNFKLINADLVRFGVRKNNALFADFSAAQDGSQRRCQMYVIPLRGRSYRVTVWAPADKFENWLKIFRDILTNVSL